MIPKSDFDSAKSYIETILSEPVENVELTNHIPTSDEVTDSNTAFKGKLSILFVDMRKSTDLTDELKSKKMVKVYRSFIRTIIQAIRYSGGHARQFAGDGIMGVFQDDTESDNKVLSAQKAVQAARYIITMIDYCLNPLLSKKMNGLAVGCGVGICTGEILITKVGMRGREKDDKIENETGIVWTGKTTNYASRHCSLAAAREVFIDESTYKELAEKDVWVETTRLKGSKSFKGYTVIEYYLSLPEDINIEAVKADDEINEQESFVQQIFAETQKNALSLIDEIAKKSAELSVAIENAKKREEAVKLREAQVTSKENRLINFEARLDDRQDELNDKQAELNDKGKENKADEYNLYIGLFSNTFCKDSLIEELGKDYWIKLIDKMFALGQNIGKNKESVISDLDCYLVDIYSCFSMYEEAYDALCIHAKYSTWLTTRNFARIVKESKHWSRLRDVLLLRRTQSISTSTREYVDQCLKLLKEAHPYLYDY